MKTETHTFLRNASLLLGLFGLSACGAPPPDQTSPASQEPALRRLQTLDYDLLIGSSGEDVRAVHRYLTTYGYFPNDKLGKKFPAWRPVVAKAPASPTIYDERTEQAIRHLQRVTGVAESGVVDEATREVLRQARCGRPEGADDLDPENKYAFSLNSPGIARNGTLWFEDGSIDQEGRLAEALNTWGSTTDIALHHDPDPDLDISWTDDVDGALALTTYNPIYHTWTLEFDYTYPWFYGPGNSVPGGYYDFRSVLLHELGHVMGFRHSGWGNSTSGSVMYPTLPYSGQWANGITFNGMKRDLAVDDKVAASIRYDTWAPALAGLAEDIGMSNVEGSMWLISSTDHSIWKWDGGIGFQRDSANGDARRIAVDNGGRPWVAAPWGVYRRTSADPFQGTWQPRWGVCAMDIGIGSEPLPASSPPGTIPPDAIWAISCDGDLYKFDGLWWNIDIKVAAGTARRVAVDNLGTPWLLTSNGIVYHRSNGDPNNGYYVDLPGKANDIAVGPFPYAWRVSQTPGPGGYVIEAFNYQPYVASRDPAPDRWQWIPINRSGINVTVGPNGELWHTDATNHVFKTNK